MKRIVTAICVLLLAVPLACSCAQNNSAGTGAGEGRNSTEAAAKAEAWVDNDILDLCIYNTDTLNPLTTSVKHNAEVLSFMYDSLYTAQSDFSAAANLAENASVSPDGLTYSVQIRSGVQFSNGETLAANDVAASINTIIASNGYYKNRLTMIKGAAAKGNRVEIYLKKPTANLNVLLDFPILPKGGKEEHAKGENNDVLSSVIPGSGIYQLSEYQLNKEIRLKVNRSHHSGAMPYIETVVIHMAADRETAVSMLENSRIDVLTGYAADIETYTPRKKLNYKTYNGCRFVFLGMNTKEKEANTPKVRSAVSAAIHREDILSAGNVNAIISSLPVHPGAYLYSSDTDLYGINQSGAGGLLTAEGWADTDSNGILDKTVLSKKYELSFELLVSADSPTKTLIAESIRKSLSALGINIKIRSLPYAAYQSKIASGDYELFLGETELLPNFDFDDISTLSKLNQKDIALSDEIKDTQSATDSMTQKENYSQILSLYSAQRPVAGLYFKNEVLLCDERIKADNILTLNPYKSVHTWSIAD